MAAAKRNTEQGYILTEEQVNRLSIVLEQIGDMAELLLPYLGDAKDDPSLTAYNVIREKAREASALILSAVR
jgi:hypothetical protein